MGADGGSVPKRSELVSTVKVGEEATSFGKRCALSGERLHDPLVADWRGRVYNKTSILELLLGESQHVLPADAQISSLRDVVEIDRKLVDGLWELSGSNESGNLLVCNQRSVLIPECGHVLRERDAVGRMTCLVCEQSFRDAVLLNAQSPADVSSAKLRLKRLRADNLTHSLRSAKTTSRAKRRPRRLSSDDDGGTVREITKRPRSSATETN